MTSSNRLKSVVSNCGKCKHFMGNTKNRPKNYSFCENANHSGRLEVMASYLACDKFEEGNFVPLFKEGIK